MSNTNNLKIYNINKKKVCSLCKQEKEIISFGKSSKSKDGLRGQCKTCRHIKRVKQWKKFKKNSTSDERTARYLKNKFRVDKWLKEHPESKDRKNQKMREKNKNRSFEDKKQRRLKNKESHLRAKKKYNEKKKFKLLKNEISQNKLLYQKIIIDFSILTIKEICQKYDISIRFYKRLVKYRGNCYKKETVIDRIKPSLDIYFQEIGIREKTFNWLVNTNGYKLRIDIFYLKANIAIEYNGPQHYKEIGYGNLKEVQHRDEIKKELLKEYKIQLLIFDSEESVAIFMEEKFQEGKNHK